MIPDLESMKDHIQDFISNPLEVMPDMIEFIKDTFWHKTVSARVFKRVMWNIHDTTDIFRDNAKSFIDLAFEFDVNMTNFTEDIRKSLSSISYQIDIELIKEMYLVIIKILIDCAKDGLFDFDQFMKENDSGDLFKLAYQSLD